MQLLHVACWEVADIKVLLAILSAFCCFALHNAQQPQVGFLWSLWWLFNSQLSLAGLSTALLAIYATQMILLRQASHLTVGLIFPLI